MKIRNRSNRNPGEFGHRSQEHGLGDKVLPDEQAIEAVSGQHRPHLELVHLLARNLAPLNERLRQFQHELFGVEPLLVVTRQG